MASEQYGMTGAGFIPKRLADIQSDLNLELANIVDPSTGEYPFQNAADDAILQQVVGVFASALEEAWEAAYEASVQFDPQKNAGAGQSGTVQLNAITRKAGTRTILSFDLTGTPGVLVPAGTLIGKRRTPFRKTSSFPRRRTGSGHPMRRRAGSARNTARSIPNRARSIPSRPRLPVFLTRATRLRNRSGRRRRLTKNCASVSSGPRSSQATARSTPFMRPFWRSRA